MRATWIGALLLCAACTHAPPRGVAEASPPEEPVPASPHAQLEEIFWQCDYVATTKGIDATPMRECATATRELRRVKFDGSFYRMLDWWREHKAAEHGRIRRSRDDPPL